MNGFVYLELLEWLTATIIQTHEIRAESVLKLKSELEDVAVR